MQIHLYLAVCAMIGQSAGDAPDRLERDLLPTPSQAAPATPLPAASDPPLLESAEVDRYASPRTFGDHAADASLVPADHLEEISDALKLVAAAAPRSMADEFEARPLGLSDAFSATVDPARQVEVAASYWRLWSEAARYAALKSAESELAVVRPHAAEDAVMFEAAFNDLDARLGQARLDVVAAQFDLVRQAGLPLDAPLPFPTDAPHAGAYHTRFDAIFAARAATAQATMLDRMLPLRRQLIDAEAKAVRAARAAWSSTVGSHDRGEINLSTLVSRLSDRIRAEQRFYETVYEYNREIAQYALPLAPPHLSGDQLAAMLIKTPVNRAPQASAGGQPTLAPPRNTAEQAGFDEPFDARNGAAESPTAE